MLLFPNGRDRTREHRAILHTPDPIKFPSLEAVNSQHRESQEEVDNKVLWLCGSSGEEGVNEKLSGEKQPQPQGLKDPEELQGCALNIQVCQSPSLTASQGRYEPLCATLINIPMPAPHYPWIQHSLHSFSALVFTNSSFSWKSLSTDWGQSMLGYRLDGQAAHHPSQFWFSWHISLSTSRTRQSSQVLRGVKIVVLISMANGVCVQGRKRLYL